MIRKFGEIRNAKRPYIGMGIMIPNAAMVEMVGYAGFDFVVIDEEHAEFGAETSISLVRAAEAADVIPIIRVAEVNEVNIKKALDTGASGIVVPNIGSRKEAEAAAAYSRFAPAGTRGACPCVRANQYGLGDESYYMKANRDVALIALVEGVEGIKHFDEIISVPGIDAIYIGPVDLSISMGLNGQIYHPKVIEAMVRMVDMAKERGCLIGTYCVDVQEAKKWIKRGVDFVDFSTDSVMFMEKCKNTIDAIMTNP